MNVSRSTRLLAPFSALVLLISGLGFLFASPASATPTVTLLTINAPGTITYNSTITVSGTLVAQGTNAPVPGKAFHVSAGTQTCDSVTDANGNASCQIAMNQLPGQIPITVSTAGDGTYLAGQCPSTPNCTVQATMPKLPTVLTWTGDTSGIAGQAQHLAARLTSNGSPLVGKNVYFTLQSATCSGVTDSSGNAGCNVFNGAGTFTYAARFPNLPGGDPLYGDATQISGTFSVSLPTPTVTYTGDTTGEAGATATMGAHVAYQGTNVSNSVVQFSIGSASCSGTSNSNGDATCTLVVPASPGSQTLTFVGGGRQNDYSSTSHTTTFTVTKGATTIVFNGPTTASAVRPFATTATITSHGAPVVGRVLHWDTGGGGPACSAVTDSTGTASCNISYPTPGTYTLTLSFDGSADDLYNDGSVTQQMTISQAPTFSAYIGDTSGANSSVVHLNGVLTSNQQGVSGKTVTFTVGTQSCQAVSSNGQVGCSLILGQTQGQKTLTMSFAGDTVYQGSSYSGTFTVNGPAATTVTGLSPSTAVAGTPTSVSGTFLSGTTGLVSKSVTFTLGTQSCNATTDTNGAATCSILLNQNPGTVSLTGSYAGDSFSSAGSGTTSTTIQAASTTMTYSGPSSTLVGTPVTFTATLTAAGGGGAISRTILFTAGPKSCAAVTDVTGTASCTVTFTQAYSGTVTASYAGSTTQQASSDTKPFAANPPSLVTVSTWTGPATATYGDTVTASGTLTSSSAPVPGMAVVLTIGNQSCAATTDSAGVGSCPIVMTQVGQLSTSITFATTGNYIGSTNSSTINVAQRASQTTYGGPTTATAGSQVTLTAQTTSGAGPVNDGTVTFTIGSATCTAATANGTASCSLTVPLTPGSTSVSTAWSGDTNTLPSSVSTGFTITPIQTSSTWTGPTSASYGGTVTASGTLSTAAGGLAGQSVVLAIGSQSCTVVTDAAGNASCTITLTQGAGSLTSSITYAGATPYTSTSNAVAFTINPLGTTAVFGGPTTAVSNSTTGFQGRLMVGSSPLAGKPVTLTVGTQFCTTTTANDGTATCSITVAQGPGSTTASISFAGDQNYLPSSDTEPFTVTKIPTTISYTGPASAFTTGPVTLSGGVRSGPGLLVGKPLTFTMGSQSCTATTSSTGTASCTITISQAAGSVTSVGVAFAGDATFLPSSTSAPFTILKYPVTLTYTGPTTVVTGNPVALTGTLTSSSAPVTGKTVSFTLGTQSCSATTDATGTASCSITVTQLPGSATSVSAAFAGDAVYLAGSASSPFTITKRPVIATYTGTTTGIVTRPVTMSGKLFDGSTPLAGKSVTFTLGTQSCTGTVNGLGAVSCAFTLTQLPGSVTSVSMGFAGDATYLPGSATSTFTIIKAATAIVANPTVTGTSQPKVSANLTSYGVGLGGQTVSFVALTTHQAICTGVTNAAGYVTCGGTPGSLKVLLGGGYTATYAGNATYVGSSAKGRY